MANFERRSVNYTTDEGQEVAIQVVYFNNVAISPEDRLSIGGFEDSNDCGLITPRRRLKPRQVTLEIEDSDGNPIKLDVYVKDKDTYQSLIDDPESPSEGKVVKYQGEASSICIPSN